MSIDFPKEEEVILKRWKEIKAFERQLELSEGRKHYTFYDGFVPEILCSLPLANHCVDLLLLPVFPTTGISWPPPSRTSSPDTGR